MTLLQQAGAAVLLLSVTLSLQCGGAAALILWIRSIPRESQRVRVFRCAALVMQTTVAVILLHGIVILLWASCYRWLCFPSWESAFYFSASSYATVGYGDVVLPSKWRLLGPLESMVGMLMSGVSIGLLFAAAINSHCRRAASGSAPRGARPSTTVNPLVSQVSDVVRQSELSPEMFLNLRRWP